MSHHQNSGESKIKAQQGIVNNLVTGINATISVKGSTPFVGHNTVDTYVKFPGNVNRNSFVLANVTEFNFQGGGTFLGSAPFTLQNVVPQDDGTIHFRVRVDWPSPLYGEISFIVFN